MRHKVLWVEDGAFSDLGSLLAPIYVSGDYDLIVALDASEGYRYLMEKKFDAVIMDIRLPPGKDPYFIRLHKNREDSKAASRLGLAVLRRVLKPSNNQEEPPSWITAERFAVFTVESKKELESELTFLGISNYWQKTETRSKTVLIDIIEEIRKVVHQKRGVR